MGVVMTAWGYCETTVVVFTDLGQVGIAAVDVQDPQQAQIEAFRDSGKIVNLYGTLLSNVPGYNGSEVQVDRIEVEE